MRRAFLASVFGAVSVVASCASPYTDTAGSIFNPFDDQTVAVVALDTNLIEVRASGNTSTSQARVADFIRLKAAEETLARGLTHFVIMSEQDYSKYTEKTRIEDSTDLEGIFRTEIGVSTEVEPERAARILMVSEADAPVGAFRAQLVYDQLAPKYLGPNRYW